MDPQRYQLAKRILLEALELPADDRAAHIAKQAAQHPEHDELEAEVLDLLARQESVAGVIDQGLISAAPPDEPAQPTQQHTPTTIGPFEIVGQLGEGGMGVVYRGRQTHPIQRDVAVKVLRAGMSTERILERFEWERRTLARMNHPNIARILDAGSQDGLPWVALELIDGEPITACCHSNKIPISQRITLMERVCQAVQHAHDRGVLHRDLKPSNILVHEIDGEPVPTIIDFGIAKALTDTDPGEKPTDLTLPGHAIGTPAYMSPEQIAAAENVDVRTDVYALGVILYELLAGCRPYTDEELANNPTRDDPPPPSRAAQNKRLRGDLDWICLRAIHPDRERRYRSAAELGEDLKRYRERRPVHARPDSWSYRTGKTLRRHPALAALGAAAIAFVLLGAVFLTWHVQRLDTERTRAVAAERHAHREAAAAEEIATFLENLFVGMDPIEEGQEPTTARELLDEGARQLTESADIQPAERGRLWGVLGRVNQNLARHELAETQLRASLAAYAEAADTNATLPGQAEVRRMLAICLHDLGKYAESETAFRHAIETHDRAYPELDIARVQLTTDLATAIQAQGRVAEAVEMLKEAAELARRLGEAGQEEVAYIANLRGYLLYQLGRYVEALDDMQSALAQQRELLDQDNIDLTASLNNVGGMLLEMHRPDEALPYIIECRETLERIFQGKEHPAITRAIGALGSIAAARGDTAQAIVHFEEAYALYVEQLGPDHPSTFTLQLSLAEARGWEGQNEEAYDLFTGALRLFDESIGPDHLKTARAHQRFGAFLRGVGRPDEARRHLETAIAAFEKRGLEQHPRLAEVRLELATLLADQQEANAASALAETAFPVLLETWGEEDPETRRARALMSVRPGRATD